jgi:hypothetical protein
LQNKIKNNCGETLVEGGHYLSTNMGGGRGRLHVCIGGKFKMRSVAEPEHMYFIISVADPEIGNKKCQKINFFVLK